MAFRHRDNKNLVLLNGSDFKGLEVLSNCPMAVNHLASIQRVIDLALQEHGRSFAIRFDLRLPRRPDCIDFPNEYGTDVISRFIASFKAQVEADLHRKSMQGKRTHPCTVRYIWVKERNEALQDHYHVVFFLNKESYFTLGNYLQPGANLATKIVNAWSRALNIEYFQAGSLVHFPSDTPCYYLSKNSASFALVYRSLFKRLSYFAKMDTKHYGNRSHSFDCSRK